MALEQKPTVSGVTVDEEQPMSYSNIEPEKQETFTVMEETQQQSQILKQMTLLPEMEEQEIQI